MPRAKQPNPSQNRTDLLSPSAPGRKMAAPDQEYGKQTAQQQSQTILPVGLPEQPSGAPAPAPAAPAVPPGGGAVPAQERPGPGEFLTHPGGPGAHPALTTGAGPEGLVGPAAAWAAQRATGEQGTLQSVLSHLAAQPQSSSIIRNLAASAGR